VSLVMALLLFPPDAIGFGLQILGRAGDIRRRVFFAKGKGVWRRTVGAQMVEPRQRLVNRWNMTRRHPPQAQERLIGLLEPFAAADHDFGMVRAVDEFEQRFDRRPYRHIDQELRVGADLDVGGVAAVAFEAPDEAW